MKAPICENCLQSESLCDQCKQKLDDNIITQKDIEVSRFINTLSQKIKSLKNVTIVKAIDATILTIVCGLGDGPMLVGRNGSVVKVLAKKFKKNIKIIEYYDNFEEFARKLLEPAEITISSVFSPEGQYYKIKIPSQQESNIGFTNQCLEKIFKDVCNKNVKVVFEN
ncbi:MAG: hypothetical protein J7K26_04125 [Candidatus Aenigmarchaeota archaeon]|nr:hypothetical protein [Candidatus Aenigmarchaeota archaeon]